MKLCSEEGERETRLLKIYREGDKNCICDAQRIMLLIYPSTHTIMDS